MKKIIILLLLAFALNGCAPENDSPTVRYELLPIVSCRMPYSFVSGETYEFTMVYKNPSSCHFYKGIYFEKQGNTRIVAIQSAVIENNNCITYPDNSAATPEPETAKYNFKATGHGSYTFRFWTGKNAAGEDTFYDVEVPVE